MKTIIACDLHGIHAELRALCAPLGEALTFLSPWEGEGCPYASEALAHQALIAERGIEAYADRIAQCAAGEPVFLVAFSVGATAAWLHASSGEAHPGSAAVLFYGSRIREHAQRLPKFPVEAIFAEREAAFEPAALVAALERERVRCAIVPGTAHGFMNPCSVNFAAVLAARLLGKVVVARDAWRAAVR
jgi:dienelactone hydrolase